MCQNASKKLQKNFLDTQCAEYYYTYKGTKCVKDKMEMKRMNDIIAKKLREARGQTPRAVVCEACGISISALMMYENGKRIPRDTIKLRLAKFYNKSIEELFFFT